MSSSYLVNLTWGFNPEHLCDPKNGRSLASSDHKELNSLWLILAIFFDPKHFVVEKSERKSIISLRPNRQYVVKHLLSLSRPGLPHTLACMIYSIQRESLTSKVLLQGAGICADSKVYANLDDGKNIDNTNEVLPLEGWRVYELCPTIIKLITFIVVMDFSTAVTLCQ